MTNDPREAWQLQPSEEYKMSLEQLRLKSQQLVIKIRFQFVAISGTVLGLILFDAWTFHMSPYPLQRAGYLLAIGWAFSAFTQAGQSIWPSSLSREAEWVTCLAFSRHELQRRLKYSSYIWRGLAAPALFTVAVGMAPALLQTYKTPADFPKMAPVLVLLVIWAVMFTVMKRRERRKLRQEMEELESLGNEPSQAL
jgi:hypothetical protein